MQEENHSPSKGERIWALLCHIVGFIFPVIITLVLWLSKKDSSDYINFHGKEALNFQITMAIYTIISIVLIYIMIGYLFLIVIGIFYVVAIIMATYKAAGGEEFYYPMSMRFIKGK